MRVLLGESKVSSFTTILWFWLLLLFYFCLNQCIPFPTSESAPPQYHAVFSRISLSSQEGHDGVIDSTSSPRAVGCSWQPISISFEMLFTSLQKCSLFSRHTEAHGLLPKVPGSTPAHPFILPADTRLIFLNLILHFIALKRFFLHYYSHTSSL